GWDPDKHFYIPPEVGELFHQAVSHGEELYAGWQAKLDRYAAEFPQEAAELRRRIEGRLPDGWDAGLPTWAEDAEPVATRNASQDAIQAMARALPELFGGAADLSESNLTDVKGADLFEADEPGRNIRYGVREHAMGGASNGMAYHGGLIPYAGT